MLLGFCRGYRNFTMILRRRCNYHGVYAVIRHNIIIVGIRFIYLKLLSGNLCGVPYRVAYSDDFRIRHPCTEISCMNHSCSARTYKRNGQFVVLHNLSIPFDKNTFDYIIYVLQSPLLSFDFFRLLSQFIIPYSPVLSIVFYIHILHRKGSSLKRRYV